MTFELGKKIGLIADSHSNNSLMNSVINSLRNSGAEAIVHLGDIVDVGYPNAIDESVNILKANHIRAVKGNNEVTMLAGSSNGLNEDTISYLKALPFIIESGDILFAHSVPFNWPAATRRTIQEYLPLLLSENSLPFKILFRGHSHSPSLIEIEGRSVNETAVQPDESVRLQAGMQYVITVGAVEDGFFAMFSYEKNEVAFHRLGG